MTAICFNPPNADIRTCDEINADATIVKVSCTNQAALIAELVRFFWFCFENITLPFFHIKIIKWVFFLRGVG